MAARKRKITVTDQFGDRHELNIDPGTTVDDVLRKLNYSGKTATVNGKRVAGDYCLNSGDNVVVTEGRMAGA